MAPLPAHRSARTWRSWQAFFRKREEKHFFSLRPFGVAALSTAAITHALPCRACCHFRCPILIVVYRSSRWRVEGCSCWDAAVCCSRRKWRGIQKRVVCGWRAVVGAGSAPTRARRRCASNGTTPHFPACSSSTHRKYEEIYAPPVDEFVYISDNTYTREEVSWLAWRAYA